MFAQQCSPRRKARFELASVRDEAPGLMAVEARHERATRRRAVVGRREVTFEGQAAIELEAIVDPACTGRYPFEITGDELDFRPMIECIVREREHPPVVAARFHNTLAAAIHQVCIMLRQEAAINRVCLSGGTFQNMRLLGLASALLRDSAFEVYLHREVPPNDGGLALGQAAIAAELLSS